MGQSRKHLFLSQRALSELKLAEQNPHSALKRLCALRDEQNIFSEFRRRSGHATAQARIQSIILWCLFALLSGLVIFQSSWSRSQGFVLGALAFFILGQITFNMIIRKRKWKI